LLFSKKEVAKSIWKMQRKTEEIKVIP